MQRCFKKKPAYKNLYKDFQRLLKTFEEDAKMFQLYTNKFKGSYKVDIKTGNTPVDKNDIVTCGYLFISLLPLSIPHSFLKVYNIHSKFVTHVHMLM